MRKIFALIIVTLLFSSCDNTKVISSINQVNWGKRMIGNLQLDSLKSGSTYLSVYSEIYSETEHKTHPLTATVSIRNANKLDSIFVLKAEYFDTSGKPIRSYFNQPIFLGPMETVEIVIDQEDLTGGTGANFIFEWSIKPTVYNPIFECVMISTYGQQGLSFTTTGYQLKQ